VKPLLYHIGLHICLGEIGQPYLPECKRMKLPLDGRTDAGQDGLTLMSEYVDDLGSRIWQGQVGSLARALRQFGEGVLHLYLPGEAIGLGGGGADSLYGRCRPITLAVANSKAFLTKAA
jgi:hypothetical protein